MRVVHDRTRGGRLFQTVGEAMRKAGEPNDKLDRATDRTLAEADRKPLCGLCRYSKLASPDALSSKELHSRYATNVHPMRGCRRRSTVHLGPL